MRLLLSLCIALGAMSVCRAQAPEPYQATLSNVPHQGWRIVVSGHQEAVEDEWVAYWKEIGKSKRARDGFVISEITWSGLSATQAEAYATVTEIDAGHTYVFLCVEAAAMGPGIDQELLVGQILEDFEFRYYRNELEALIEEAEAVESYLSRATFKSNKEIDKLERSLVRNATERERLEAQLAENEQEQAMLQQELSEQRVLRLKAREDLEIIEERLEYLRQRLINFTQGEQAVEQ